MSRITLRYKKPKWKEWVYLIADPDEVEKWARELRANGYIVEY